MNANRLTNKFNIMTDILIQVLMNQVTCLYEELEIKNEDSFDKFQEMLINSIKKEIMSRYSSEQVIKNIEKEFNNSQDEYGLEESNSEIIWEFEKLCLDLSTLIGVETRIIKHEWKDFLFSEYRKIIHELKVNLSESINEKLKLNETLKLEVLKSQNLDKNLYKANIRIDELVVSLEESNIRLNKNEIELKAEIIKNKDLLEKVREFDLRIKSEEKKVNEDVVRELNREVKIIKDENNILKSEKINIYKF